MVMNILCYGDSNTWGYRPAGGGRYDGHTRWPSVMQQLLGAGYNVVEEGYNGRTTRFIDPGKPGRNGRETLPLILERNPLFDLVLIMLGTNDFKVIFKATVSDIVEGVSGLVDIVRTEELERGGSPKFLVLSPPLVIDDATPHIKEEFYPSRERSAALGAALRSHFAGTGVETLDTAAFIESSPLDGIHLEPAEHSKLAIAVSERVRALLG